ncbi:MAG: GTPase Era [Lachnospiraceae bacterium]|nr:GTPase Era [Lachnospiraceae bacterium]
MEEKNNKQYKSGFAAIIGRPNVGKSTLMNKIIGQKIAITSNKPQTTRNRIQTVYTDDKGQIVFLDTPGLHKQKNKLSQYMVKAAKSTFSDADVILWLVEASDHIGGGDRAIAEELKDIKTPLVLVINKADTVKHDDMYGIIDTYKDLCDFNDIVPVSALKGDNIQELISVIFEYLPYGEPFYDDDTVTDQPVRQIAAELIREKALKCLSEEVPHGIAVTIEKMQDAGRIVNIDAEICCEKDSHKAIIIGKKGSMLKKIGSAARFEIEKLVEKQVNLKLWVRVKKDWRDSDMLLKNFGYREDEL